MGSFPYFFPHPKTTFCNGFPVKTIVLGKGFIKLQFLGNILLMVSDFQGMDYDTLWADNPLNGHVFQMNDASNRRLQTSHLDGPLGVGEFVHRMMQNLKSFWKWRKNSNILSRSTDGSKISETLTTVCLMTENEVSWNPGGSNHIPRGLGVISHYCYPTSPLCSTLCRGWNQGDVLCMMFSTATCIAMLCL